MKHPFGLIIIDGFGYSKKKQYNAARQAQTPHLSFLRTHYPYKLLHASGTHVGLPPYTPGNSEVGHLTIGSGKSIPHTLTQCNEAFSDSKSLPLRRILQGYALSKSKIVHLIGLVSAGQVHSSWIGLQHLITQLLAQTPCIIKLHAFTDGRDTPPQSAQQWLDALTSQFPHDRLHIASIHGRWYAMDRDNNHERVQQSWQVLTTPCTTPYTYKQYIQMQYDQHIYDEFIIPMGLKDHAPLHKHDTIICFNMRADRMRQLAAYLAQHFPHFLAPIAYSPGIPSTPLLPAPTQTKSLLEHVHARNIPIITAAETEKYAHVTYFLNGGKETKQTNETRILIPSYTCATHDEYPQMRAQEITQALLAQLNEQPASFFVVNYANADMVGHTGNLPATIAAIECIDKEIGKLYQYIQKHQGTLIITSDHGNSEKMFDTDSGQPCTSHTTAKVPLYFIHFGKKSIPKKVQGLADLAPWILKLIANT